MAEVIESRTAPPLDSAHFPEARFVELGESASLGAPLLRRRGEDCPRRGEELQQVRRAAPHLCAHLEHRVVLPRPQLREHQHELHHLDLGDGSNLQLVERRGGGGSCSSGKRRCSRSSPATPPPRPRDVGAQGGERGECSALHALFTAVLDINRATVALHCVDGAEQRGVELRDDVDLRL